MKIFSNNYPLCVFQNSFSLLHSRTAVKNCKIYLFIFFFKFSSSSFLYSFIYKYNFSRQNKKKLIFIINLNLNYIFEIFQNFSVLRSFRNLKNATIFFFVRISLFWIQLNSPVRYTIALELYIYTHTCVYVSCLFGILGIDTNQLTVIPVDKRAIFCLPRTLFIHIVENCFTIRAKKISGINVNSFLRVIGTCLSCA